VELEQLADAVHPLVMEARRAVLGVYESGRYGEEQKEDNTPVTDADRASHNILVGGLAELFPDIPVISEESRGADQEHSGSFFWLVDPLDGTKEFIRGTGEFTINVALVDQQGSPVWGLVDVPLQQRSYVGYGAHAFVREAGGDTALHRLAPMDPAKPRAVALSRSHRGAVDEWLREHHIEAERVVYAGSAVKFCWLAEGRIDLYVRLMPTMGWDTAAGQALVEAVGGTVHALPGGRLTYRPRAEVNPSFAAQAPQAQPGT
jgi:3'(2'), 5'-bisphosphate nucleotidase